MAILQGNPTTQQTRDVLVFQHKCFAAQLFDPLIIQVESTFEYHVILYVKSVSI